MKNLMKKTIGAVAGIALISGFLLIHDPQPKVEAQDLILEKFKITENENGQIHGDIIYSQSGAMGGEGIYIDKTYKGYEDVKDVKAGQILDIKWTKKDYENDVWDNIYSAEIEE
jgi:hypothetical protein